jgi:hypothetical protein
MQIVGRAIYLSIDVINFNFRYKYYNGAMNYHGNHDLKKILRHLCNAAENPAPNQKVRPKAKLTALSSDATRFFQFGTGIANMFAVTLPNIVRRIYGARHGSGGGLPRGKIHGLGRSKCSVLLINVGRPGAGVMPDSDRRPSYQGM